MNNLSTKIILINQYFRLFFNFYTPPNSNICIHQVSRQRFSGGNAETASFRVNTLNTRVNTHASDTVESEFSGACRLTGYSGMTVPCGLRSRCSHHRRVRARSVCRGDSVVGDLLRRLHRYVSAAGCLSYCRRCDVVRMPYIKRVTSAMVCFTWCICPAVRVFFCLSLSTDRCSRTETNR